MDFAIRHGVLGYEAMDLNRFFQNLPFGVHNYEATRGAEGAGGLFLRFPANALMVISRKVPGSNRGCTGFD
jgi:hypothetical protein